MFLTESKVLNFVVVVCAGDPAAALRLTSQLMSLGADVSLRSRWTNMNALHYAAYFDVPELIRVLLKEAKPRGTPPPVLGCPSDRRPWRGGYLLLLLLSTVLNSTCSDFHYGTALHIAASNLCLSAVKCLLEHGASPTVRVGTSHLQISTIRHRRQTEQKLTSRRVIRGRLSLVCFCRMIKDRFRQRWCPTRWT